MGRTLHISTGASRKATAWKTKDMTWEDLVKTLKDVIRVKTNYDDYIRLTKPEQDAIKDVGGYVGGELDGRRLAGNVKSHDLVTLDLDSVADGETEDVLAAVAMLGCAAFVYSTLKHHPKAPRLRVIIPLDRSVNNDEYVPIARKVAELIGIERCDPTTFDVNRLMYWPTCTADGVCVSEAFDGPELGADAILALYHDWRDVREWPMVSGAETAIMQRAASKQQDPLSKDGLIGAFCRQYYPITEAMEQLLPGVYLPTDQADRWTFAGGSTAGGAVLYDDKYLYSHHATDPCSGLLVNAWDLVRLHLFGDEDKGKEYPDATKAPSYKRMTEMASKDKPVVARLQREKMAKAAEIFGSAPAVAAAEAPELPVANAVEADDGLSMPMLELDKSGRPLNTIRNAEILIEHTPELAGLIGWDDMMSAPVALGPLPWNLAKGHRRWGEADDAGLHSYMEQLGITSRVAVDEAVRIVQSHRRVNVLKDYLEGLVWDGTPRIETMLPDYLGVEDTPYTRAVARKFMAAAYMRGTRGGGKFDYMPILTGPQGQGKSTFIATLAGEWFSDSLTSFGGKEAAEQVQGVWICEIAELNAFSKSDVSEIKQFVSRQDDLYRPAYGKRVESHPRRCVMIGTSNTSDYLRDATGNRRFWPIDTYIDKPKLSVFDDLPKARDQLWAEAGVLYDCGEELYLKGDIAKQAMEAQERHEEVDDRTGVILEYLDKRLPVNWYDMTSAARTIWLASDASAGEDPNLVLRSKVCVAEIWTEALGGDMRYLRKADARDINAVLGRLPEWERTDGSIRFGIFGKQRGWVRKIV